MNVLNLSQVPPALATPFNEEAPSKPRHRRRERSQLSCTICRQKKLKCDRNLPCENCATRGRGDACFYTNTQSQGQVRTRHRPTNTSIMQNRVRHLESTVLPLASGRPTRSARPRNMPSESRSDGIESYPYHNSDGAQYTYASASSGSPAEVNMPITKSVGKLSMQNNGDTSHPDTEQWGAILTDIGELKGYFEDRDDGSVSDAVSEDGEYEPDLLSGRLESLTQAEILERVPPKQLVDHLVSAYFNSLDDSTVIIHRPLFWAQYKKFWQDPWSTPLMWVGLLFSMICIAVRTDAHPSHRMPDTFEPHGLTNQYRQMAAHCLRTSNYSTTPPHTLEALVLYFFAENIRSLDAQVGCWYLFGIIMRIAMRKGYHRDARHYPEVSVFDGEMRRRVWTIIFDVDIFTSVQSGLPRAVRPSHTDTEPPRNILDEDYDENTTSLPPPRPDVDNPVLEYLIAKRQLVQVYGMIVDLDSATQQPSYEEVLRLDKELLDTHRSVPSLLRIRPIETSVDDPPHIIIRRLILDFLYHKARCMLHRRYCTMPWSNSRYTYSRQTCFDAAMAILQQQVVLNREAQPGGLVHRVEWMITSLVSHDFFLAAMIICLYLDRENDKGGNGVGGIKDTDTIAPGGKEEMLRQLRTSYNVFSIYAPSSRSSARTCTILKIILQRLGVIVPPPNEGGPAQEVAEMAPLETLPYTGPGAIHPTSTPYKQPGIYPQTVASSTTTTQMPFIQLDSVELPDVNINEDTRTIESLIQSSQDIDWDLWDTLFRSGTGHNDASIVW